MFDVSSSKKVKIKISNIIDKSYGVLSLPNTNSTLSQIYHHDHLPLILMVDMVSSQQRMRVTFQGFCAYVQFLPYRLCEQIIKKKLPKRQNKEETNYQTDDLATLQSAFLTKLNKWHLKRKARRPSFFHRMERDTLILKKKSK